MKFTSAIFDNAILQSEMAEKAQAAFDKWLSEQQVVYGDKLQDVFTTYKEERDTHKARLVCIEELAPKVCKHEKVTGANTVGYICRDCNKTLKPNWEAV
jgi:predicted outer membrane protein